MRQLPRVETVDRSHEARVVATHTMAFANDPFWRWMFPDAAAYLQAFPDFVRAFGRPSLESGTTYQVGDFGGASMWFPPGVEADGDATIEFFKNALRGSKLSETFQVLEAMGQHHDQSEPHWYLAIIGVDLARQQEGLGSALIKHTLEECDRKGMSAHLESSNPRNIPFYQRHGFEAVAEIRIGSCPVVTPMTRSPG